MIHFSLILDPRQVTIVFSSLCVRNKDLALVGAYSLCGLDGPFLLQAERLTPSFHTDFAFPHLSRISPPLVMSQQGVVADLQNAFLPSSKSTDQTSRSVISDTRRAEPLLE